MNSTSLLRRLHCRNCPVLKNEWENGERTGSDVRLPKVSVTVTIGVARAGGLELYQSKTLRLVAII